MNTLKASKTNTAGPKGNTTSNDSNAFRTSRTPSIPPATMTKDGSVARSTKDRMTPLQQRRERSLIVAASVGNKVDQIASLVPRVVLASPHLKATSQQRVPNDGSILMENGEDVFPTQLSPNQPAASARLRQAMDASKAAGNTDSDDTNNNNNNNYNNANRTTVNSRLSTNYGGKGSNASDALNNSQSVLKSMPLSRTVSIRDKANSNGASPAGQVQGATVSNTPSDLATRTSMSKKAANGNSSATTAINSPLKPSTYATATSTKDGTKLFTGVGYIASVVDKPVDLTLLKPTTTSAQGLVGAVACDGAFHLSAKSNHWVNVHNAKEENFRLRSTQKMVGLSLSQQLHDTHNAHETATGLSDDHQRVNQKRIALLEDKMAANYEQFLVNTSKREVAKHCHESRLLDARAAKWTAPIYLALTAQLMARAVQVARAREVLKRLFMSRSLAYLRRKKALAKRRELIQVHEDALVEKPSNDLLRIIIPAVTHLPDALLTKISENLTKRCYLPAEFITYAGEPGDTCFILGRGVIECTSLTSDTIQQIQNNARGGPAGGDLRAATSSSQIPASNLPQTDLSEALSTFKLSAKSYNNNVSSSTSGAVGVATLQKQWTVLCRSVLLTPEEYEHTFRACPTGTGADFWVISHAKFSQLCDSYFSEQAKLLKGVSVSTLSDTAAAASKPDKGGKGGAAPEGVDSSALANTSVGGVTSDIRQLESIMAARDWYLRSIDGRRELNMIRYQSLTQQVVRKASSLFTHWSPQGLQGIIDKARPLVHRKDDIVVREGKYGKELLLVVAGKLELLLDGKRISVISSGSCVGDIAAAAGLRSPTTSIKALTNAAVWVIDHKDVEALVVREDANIFMASVLTSVDEHGHERLARQAL